MQTAILAPAAALVAWSLLMMIWMTLTRFAGMAQAGVDLKAATPGGRGQDLEAVLPAKTVWKAHNFTHLMEQPTLFYALVMILALAGAAQWDVRLAWAYVALRIVHSLWQALVNTIPVRVSLFAISSTVLVIMAVRALMLTL